ncbi:MAG: GTPase ObgE [Bacillota bacterium]
MFVDELELLVRGGRGGNGAVSFRREKYVPKGGPDGGDGGKGGDVYLWADPSKHSFLDLRYRHTLKASNGTHGKGKNQHGADGSDLLVPVPVGTVVRDLEDNVWADLTKEGQKALVAKGGQGGKGNARFASSRRRVPRLAEKGLPGEERKIKLELKLMAQVGLVGLPNAGKSTLLSRITAAKPKVASYPFTTLTPNLGVVKVGDEGNFIIADLPGLIEGAHQGVGLGHQFLRHVERTLILLFLLDLDPEADHEPAEAYQMLKHEISLYRSRLANYPRVVVGNKLDLTGADEQLAKLKNRIIKLEGENIPVFGIAAFTGLNVKELIWFLYEKINDLSQKEETEAEPVSDADEETKTLLSIEKFGNAYYVKGEEIEKMAAKTDFENEEALRRFQNFARRIGLEWELKKLGIKEGDTVRIGDEEFDYYD